MRQLPLHFGILLTIVFICTVSCVASAATNQQIDESIKRAKAFLLESQNQSGDWEESRTRDKKESGQSIVGGQWGGTTAMCTYALLAAGESPQDPRIAKAIDFLKGAELAGVYALGMRCQVWLLLPQTPETKSRMKRDADALLGMIKTQGPGRGFYDYTDVNPTGAAYSLSRSQYAVQGLWAASQLGVEIPDTYWKTVESAWVDQQEHEGGWCYAVGGRKEYPTTAGITSVAVATLFITQEFLHAREGAECKGNITSPPIDRGIKWLADHMDEVAPKERSPRAYPYATLYGLERVGVASGRKFFGDVAWYEKGSDWLIGKQKKDGSWPADSMMEPIADTCFSLLFLSRGREPVAFNKLEYVSEDKSAANWNQRPRDIANVARWIGRETEHGLNWQIVNLDAPLAALHDAPVLYIAGNQPLKLSNEHREKIKSYVESGGLVLGNADCSARGFAGSFEKLGEELFPTYKFRELPADHVIYSALYRRDKWKSKPSVLGLSNGARELMLLIPTGDAARTWQTMAMERVEAFQLAGNIFNYAVVSHPRRKGETYLVAADVDVKAQRTITVARIKYTGNWDPEPGGWRRLTNVMHNRGVDLQTHVVDVGDANALAKHRVAHLTGTDAVQFGAAERASLRKFIDGGGSLVIDAAGGSAAFAKSIEAELAQIFPGVAPAIVAPTHVIYQEDGKPIDIRYRAFARAALAGDTKVGRIRAIELKGRPAVLYSRDDLSVGIVGAPVDGIIGYTPDTATRVMSSALQFLSAAQ